MTPMKLEREAENRQRLSRAALDWLLILAGVVIVGWTAYSLYDILKTR